MMKKKTIIRVGPVFGALAICFVLFMTRVHPFLSAENAVNAEVLIFESWIYQIDNSVQEATEEFREGNYKALVTVGFDTRPDLGTETPSMAIGAKNEFIKNGIKADLIHTVIAPYVQRHRTFSLAFCSRIWVENAGFDINNVNVFTFGPHARKSEVVFKQAFEPKYGVGILTAKPIHYNPKIWWTSWMGFKWVFFDLLKYLRALL